MLVLQRFVNESIVITAPDGTRINVVLVAIKGSNKARIGIEAPEDYTVHRAEIQDTIDRQKTA